MARVAILGTEGTGKTVLMTVLAQRFKRNDVGIQFIPLTPETSTFVASNWECLRRADWPQSSKEGVLTRLRWEVRAHSFLPCNLQFHDVSGQEFRMLFSRTQLPQHLKALQNHVRTAEVIAFLVNLGDFIGREDTEYRAATELALINALRFANSSANPRRTAIVFTQIDLYQQQKKQFGSWEEVARRFLPNFYSEFIAVGQVSLLAVASVSNVVADPNAGPRGRLIPATHWQSIGLEDLIVWLCKSNADVELEKQQSAGRRPQLPGDPVGKPPPFPKSSGCLASVAFILFALVYCWSIAQPLWSGR